MRYATGGIGIDKVSLTLTTLNVYGNDKFVDWCKGGVVLSKVVKPGDDQFTIILTKGVKRKPNEAFKDNKWSQNLDTAGQLLPKFGLTDPVGITFVGKEMHIVIPAKAKRTALKRGHNQSTLKALEKAGVSPAHTKAPTPPANTITKVFEDVRNGSTPEESTFDEVKRLVARLNEIRTEIGEDKFGAYPVNGGFKAVFTLT